MYGYVEALQTFPIVSLKDLLVSANKVNKKFTYFLESHLNFNKIIIITAIVLSCLAIVSSLIYGSVLSLSLSVTLFSLSFYSFMVNRDLIKKERECKELQSFIINQERHEKKQSEEYAKLSKHSEALELNVAKLESLNKGFQFNLEKAVELVEFGSKALEEIGVSQKETANYKSVLNLWLSEIKSQINDHNGRTEKASKTIIRMLKDFKEGEHAELERMLTQFENIKTMIASSGKTIEEQQETLRTISQDIKKRTADLYEIHEKLKNMHLENLSTKSTTTKIVDNNQVGNQDD